MAGSTAKRSVQTVDHYTLKLGPYSSHTLLLESLAADGRGQSVLDVGCANGHLAGILAARGYRVTGVERPGLVSELPAGVELVEADLDCGLPDVGGPFDYILCADVLEHLKDPAALLSGLRPLFAPEGRLLASLPNSGHLYFRLNVMLGRFPKHDRGLFDRTHLHFFTWDEWVGLFARTGFHISRVRPTGVPVGLAFPGWQGTLPVRLLERLSYDVARGWKRMFAYQFVVEAWPAKNQ